MSHVLQAELVITDLPEDVSIPHRDEVISLVNPAVAGERQNALLGKQVVELESTELDVEPGAMENVIQAHKHLLKVKRASPIGRRKQIEGDVLLERSGGVEVEPAQVEAGTGDPLDRGPRGVPVRVSINLHLARAHPVPDRRDAERNRPISRILPDRGVP